jgi:signal transduction histidine kinase
MTLPRPLLTLAGRAVLLLLAGMALSLAIGLGFYAGDRRTQWAEARVHYSAERIAAAIRQAEPFQTQERRQGAAGLGGPGLRVAWSVESLVGPVEVEDWGARWFRKTLLEHLGQPVAGPLRIAYADALSESWDAPRGRTMGRGMGMMTMHMQHMAMMGDPGQPLMVASYRMKEGDWLNFAVPSARLEPFWATGAFAGIVFSTLVVTTLAGWLVWRSSRPLAVLAAAAERLGVDVNAPPVAEDGPVDVRMAAKAFNGMQRRLRGFVEDRTQMLAAISHDLRTPITRLRLRAEFMEDEEQRTKTLADLDEMEAMIAATLSFAREDALREPRTGLDLAALLQTLCDDAADAGRAVAYSGPDHLAFQGRPLALKRAFANLIDNAVKYGGKADVALSRTDGWAVATVVDAGPGLPDEETEKVFDPFHRVERSRSRDTGGTGLGLAVVRSAVRAHGGEVALANRPEGGLLATVRLPVV